MEQNLQITHRLINILEQRSDIQDYNSNRRHRTNRHTSSYNRHNLQSLLNPSSSYNTGQSLLQSVLNSLNRPGETSQPNLTSQPRQTNNRFRNNRARYTQPASLPQNPINSIFQNFFEPIQICPTPTQIELATRNVLYRDVLSPRNTSCPISLEAFNDNQVVTIIRYCGHIFNRDELTQWFRTNCKCPVCRYDIRTYETNQRDQSREEDIHEQAEQNIDNNQTTRENVEQPNESDNIPYQNNYPDSIGERNNENSYSLINTFTDILTEQLMNTDFLSNNQYINSTNSILFDIIYDPSNNSIPYTIRRYL
jgi:hypothetical protein